MSHLRYHNHHEVLLIYLVLLERRVIVQNFACGMTQNNENKRHVIHQPAALTSESDSCQSSIKWCRCTNTLYRCISHHFRAKPARTNPYQLETAAQTRHTITLITRREKDDVPAYINFCPATGKPSFPFSFSIFSFKAFTCERQKQIKVWEEKESKPVIRFQQKNLFKQNYCESATLMMLYTGH